MEASLPQVELTGKEYRCILEWQLIYIVFTQRESQRIKDRIKKERGEIWPESTERTNEEISLWLAQLMIYNNKSLARDEVWKLFGLCSGSVLPPAPAQPFLLGHHPPLPRFQRASDLRDHGPASPTQHQLERIPVRKMSLQSQLLSDFRDPSELSLSEGIKKKSSLQHLKFLWQGGGGAACGPKLERKG